MIWIPGMVSFMCVQGWATIPNYSTRW
jgi:hypothetical protein